MWPFRQRRQFPQDDWERGDAQRKANIDRAVAQPDVRNLLDTLNLGVQDIEEFHDRLNGIGLNDRQVRKALRDTEILEWYFSILPSDKKIEFQEFMELTGWLIKKRIV